MPRQVVIDACCTLNLLATQRELAIVTALDLHLFDTPQVSGEPLMLWTPPDTDGQRFKEPTSTDALRAAGRLRTLVLADDNLLDAFVAAAALINDTDASCIAAAGVLGIPLVTDDRKERRIARELFPNVELISTLDIIAEADRTLSWSEVEAATIAHELRWRGNFAPPRNDPRSAWYDRLLQVK